MSLVEIRAGGSLASKPRRIPGVSSVEPFAFAGLWETWKNGEEICSCAIITTDANDLMGEIHHRMPVILFPENYGVWLDPDFDEKEALVDLLKLCPSEEMEAYAVSRRVNKPANNEPSVVEPAA